MSTATTTTGARTPERQPTDDRRLGGDGLGHAAIAGVGGGAPTPPPDRAGDAGGGSPLHKTLKTRAVKGSVVWGVAYGMLQVIRLAGNVVLGHLLAPWAFGMVAIARAIQQGLQMFSEIGIKPALIQSKREDDDFVNTAWTLGAIRGVGIWFVASLLAFPMAVFYARDELVQLVPVLALTAVLSGLESTRTVSMNRELREGPRAAMEVGNALLTRLTMIVWALIAPTPWALVAGTVAGGLFSLVVSHTLLPGRQNRFRLERSAIHVIVRFGTWIFIGTLIAFLGQQIDKIMLGKLDGLGMLGVYSMAITLSSMPREFLGILSTKIMYPVLAEVAREDPPKYAKRVMQLRGAIVPAGVTCILGIVFASPWYFTLLFPTKFHDAAWISPLACTGAWFAVLNASANKALLALAKTRALAVAGLVRVVLTASGCLVGYHFLGVAGFVLGVALGSAGEHFTGLIALRRAGVHLVLTDASATLVLGGMGIAGWIAPQALGLVLPKSAATIGGLGVQAILIGASGLLALRRLLPLITLNRKVRG